MRDGWLGDGDVALLARQAVDLLAEDVDISIDPVSPTSTLNLQGRGYGEWAVWPLVDGDRSFGVRITSDLQPVQALAHLLQVLGEGVPQTRRFHGVPFPACASHPHASQIRIEDGDVVLRCPRGNWEVGRLTPAAAE